MFTRTQKSDCMLKPSLKDPKGAFLIDRSPIYFEPLLNFLRHNLMILDSNVNVNGKFFFFLLIKQLQNIP